LHGLGFLLQVVQILFELGDLFFLGHEATPEGMPATAAAT
jgi:hypothetical protein